VQADRDLEHLADTLRGTVPVARRAPEHAAVIDALERRDPVEYAAAVDELAAARRQAYDQSQCAKLMGRLRAAAPQLAEAWDRPGGRTAPGYAVLSTAASLLARMPDADSADVLVFLGADRLAAPNLLLAAAAPRVLAVAPREAVESGGDDPSNSVLATVRSAGAVLITESGEGVAPVGSEQAASRNGRPLRMPHQRTAPSPKPRRRQAPA
jgi:hypothetical protein